MIQRRPYRQQPPEQPTYQPGYAPWPAYGPDDGAGYPPSPDPYAQMIADWNQAQQYQAQQQEAQRQQQEWEQEQQRLAEEQAQQWATLQPPPPLSTPEDAIAPVSAFADIPIPPSQTSPGPIAPQFDPYVDWRQQEQRQMQEARRQEDAINAWLWAQQQPEVGPPIPPDLVEQQRLQRVAGIRLGDPVHWSQDEETQRQTRELLEAVAQPSQVSAESFFGPGMRGESFFNPLTPQGIVESAVRGGGRLAHEMVQQGPQEAWQAALRRREETPEMFPTQKFFQEAFVDPLNITPGMVAKGARVAGEAARTIPPLARAAAKELAPDVLSGLERMGALRSFFAESPGDAARQFEVLNQRYADLTARLEDIGQQAASSEMKESFYREGGDLGVVRPKTGPLAGLTDTDLVSLAQREGRNPYQADWYDSIDPIVVKDYRESIKGRTGQSKRVKQQEAAIAGSALSDEYARLAAEKQTIEGEMEGLWAASVGEGPLSNAPSPLWQMTLDEALQSPIVVDPGLPKGLQWIVSKAERREGYDFPRFEGKVNAGMYRQLANDLNDIHQIQAGYASDVTKQVVAKKGYGDLAVRMGETKVGGVTRYRYDVDSPITGHIILNFLKDGRIEAMVDRSALWQQGLEQAYREGKEFPTKVRAELTDEDLVILAKRAGPSPISPKPPPLTFTEQVVSTPKPKEQQGWMFAPGEARPEFAGKAKAGGAAEILGKPQFPDEAARARWEREQQINAGQGELGVFPVETVQPEYIPVFRGVGRRGLGGMRPSEEGVQGTGVYFYNNPIDAAAYAGRGGGIITGYVRPEDVKISGKSIVLQDPSKFISRGVIPTEETLDLRALSEKGRTALGEPPVVPGAVEVLPSTLPLATGQGELGVPRAEARAETPGTIKEPWQMTRGEYARAQTFAGLPTWMREPFVNARALAEIHDDLQTKVLVAARQQWTARQFAQSLSLEDTATIERAGTDPLTFYRQVRADNGLDVQAIENQGGMAVGKMPGLREDPHYQAVVQARAEGKPVPPEVLVEYPDLARQAGVEGAIPPPPPLSEGQVIEGQVVPPSAGVVPSPLPSTELTIPSALTEGANTRLGVGGNHEGFEITTSTGARAIGYVKNQDFPGQFSVATRGELFYVDVPPTAQRQGIGTSLAHDALRLMQANGAETVNMNTVTPAGKALRDALIRDGSIDATPIVTAQTGKTEFRITLRQPQIEGQVVRPSAEVVPAEAPPVPQATRIKVGRRVDRTIVERALDLMPPDVRAVIEAKVQRVSTFAEDTGTGGSYDQRTGLVVLDPSDVNDRDTVLHELLHAYVYSAPAMKDPAFLTKYIRARYDNAAFVDKALEQVRAGSGTLYDYFGQEDITSSLTRYLTKSERQAPEMRAVFDDLFAAKAPKAPAAEPLPPPTLLPGTPGGTPPPPPAPPIPPAAEPPKGKRPIVHGEPKSAAEAFLEQAKGTPEEAAELRKPKKGYIGNINPEKFQPETKPYIQETLDNWNQMAGQRRGVIPDVEARQNAAEVGLGMSVEDWLKSKPGRAFNEEEALALGETIERTRQEFSALSKQVEEARTAGTLTDKLLAEEAEKGLILAALIGVRTGAVAETARSLRSFRFSLSGAIQSKQPWPKAVDKAFAAIGTDREAFLDWTRKWNALSPDDTVGRYRLLQALGKPTLLQKLTAFTTSNMLSGLRTLEVNATSNVLQSINRPLITLLGGDPAAARDDVVAMGRAIGKAWADAAVTFKEGASPSAAQDAASIGKYDLPVEAFPGKQGMIITPPLRFLKATDEFTKTVNAAGALASMARREARKSGQSVQSLLKNPTDTMLAYAEKQARESVYEASATPVGNAIIRLRSSLYKPGTGNRISGLTFYVLTPFVRIPEAVFVKGVKTLAKPLTGPIAIGTKLVKRQSIEPELIGETALAAGLLTAIYAEAAAGNITGNGPKDPSKRRMLQEARDKNGHLLWQAHSIKIGDRWFDYTNLGHYAVPIAALANAVEAYREDGTKPTQEIAGEILNRTAKTMADASYIKAMGQMFTAIMEGRVADISGSLATNILSRGVPYGGAVAQIARETEQELKAPEGPLEGLAARIPGLASLVPARITPLGRVAQAPVDIGSEVSPFRASAKGEPNPVAMELSRLKLGLAAAPESVKIKGQEEPVKLSREQQQQLQIDQGQAMEKALRALFDQSYYQKADDKEKIKYVQAVESKARGLAQNMVKAELAGRKTSRTRDHLLVDAAEFPIAYGLKQEYDAIPTKKGVTLQENQQARAIKSYFDQTKSLVKGNTAKASQMTRQHFAEEPEFKGLDVLVLLRKYENRPSNEAARKAFWQKHKGLLEKYFKGQAGFEAAQLRQAG